LVAPPLALVVLPRRLSGRRALALFAVSAIFAAAKVSPAISHLVERMVGAIGVTWKLWTDPTDLVALVVLPVCWHLMSKPPANGGVRSSWADRLQRVGVVVGGVLCMATSASPHTIPQPFIINTTPSTQQIQARWAFKNFGCSLPLSQIAAAAAVGDFSQPLALQLDASAFAALDVPPRSGVSPIGHCSNDAVTPDPARGPIPGPCSIVVLELPGVAPSLARVNGASLADASASCSSTVSPSDDVAGEIRIEMSSAGAPRLVPGTQVELVDFAAAASWTTAAPSGSCQDLALSYSQELQAGRTCVADQDCKVPFAQSCDAINATAVAGAQATAAEFEGDDCVNLRPTCEEFPTLCDAGFCTVDCPTTLLEPCPSLCTMPVKTGDTCPGTVPLPCENAEGQTCTCDAENNMVTCAAPTPAPAGCREACIPSAP
jgi:hypothetical protein